MTADELAGHTNCRGSSHKMLLCNPVKENLICYMLNMIEKLLFLLGSHSNMKKNPEYWNSSPDLLENDEKLKKICVACESLFSETKEFD